LSRDLRFKVEQRLSQSQTQHAATKRAIHAAPLQITILENGRLCWLGIIGSIIPDSCANSVIWSLDVAGMLEGIEQRVELIEAARDFCPE
jgi:hypothetical protein